MKDNHIHKFKRDTYSTGKQFYYCINGCTFKIDVRHSLGKEVLCNSCNKPFKMNEYSIRKASPKCMDCVKRRTIKVKDDNHADTVVESSAVIRRSIEVEPSIRESSVEDLRKKINNLTIKEYDPNAEDDSL